MSEYEEKLKNYMRENCIPAEFLSFDSSCHTVKEAADSLGVEVEDLVKNICLMDSEGSLIVAIVRGEHRASTSRVAKILKSDFVRIATPEEILEDSGYPVGGVPSFGFDAIFLMDPKVMEKEMIYSSGGSQTSLLKISTKIMKQANNAQIVRIRK